MRPVYALPDAELLAQCDATSSSTHSPGGQHRNKAESAVRLRHRPTGLVAQCESNRDRVDNRAEALARLRLRLALRERGGADPAWLEAHRRGGGLAVTPGGAEYALVVACLLDALAAAGGQLADAARGLGLSTSQMAKTLAADKEALQAANQLRQAAGLGAIRAG
jgi:hypothetical protein